MLSNLSIKKKDIKRKEGNVMKDSTKSVLEGVKMSLVAIVIVIISSLVYANFFKIQDLQIKTGWQKVESFNGNVPKGTFIVVPKKDNLIIVDLDQEKITDNNLVVIYEKKRVKILGPVWVFSDSGESLEKKDFFYQCDQKLSELTGKETLIEHLIFVGKK